jgi:hypothetical protein
MKTFLEYLAEAEGVQLNEGDDVPADASKLTPTQASSLAGAVTMPDISNNKSNGQAYVQMRYFIALAGAHSDPNKCEEMDPIGAVAGDPMALTYTDEESKMMQNASDMVDAGRIVPLGSKRSEESSEIYKVSPHRNPGPIKLKK